MEKKYHFIKKYIKQPPKTEMNVLDQFTVVLYTYAINSHGG